MSPRGNASRRRTSIRLVLMAGVGGLALVTGCTRVLVPLGTQVSPLLASEQAAETLQADGGIPGGPIVYSVFGVPEGGQLRVRQPAGITSTVVAEIPGDLRDVHLTGLTTPLGSSTWAEIQIPSGGAGWVNLWNLTEDVSGEAFCQDPRVPALLDSFFSALRDRSGDVLSRTVSPRRGLILRHDWWNAEVVVELSDVGELMRSMEPVAWGTQRGSGAPIVGSFRERMLPELDRLLAALPSPACNALISGETGFPARWPEEYARMNFVSLHLPAPDPGPRLNWRTWAVGVEYVDSVPYIAALIRYAGDM